MRNYKKVAVVIFLAVVITVMCGCERITVKGNASNTGETAIDSADASLQFTERDLTGTYDESAAIGINLSNGNSSSTSSSVQINSDVVTIKSAGIYELTGELTNGRIVVEAAITDKVQLAFNNVKVTSSTSAALYIKNADKVFVTLNENTVNELNNGGSFVAVDANNIDSAIFSLDDITFNGSGKLTVKSDGGHGIVSKDDAVFCGGEYVVSSLYHAISGKDCVKISGGKFNLTSGKDGIHAENLEDLTLGYVLVTDGDFTIKSSGDGIASTVSTRLDGGTFNITSTLKGIKANGNVIVNGGSAVINATDDAIHSNGTANITNGTYKLSTDNDGIHADNSMTITGGEINIVKSIEGLEALAIAISGGKIEIFSTDDGINAAAPTTVANTNATAFKQPTNAAASGSIEISGGYIKVDAGGDGFDSNGSLIISGGECYVSGSTNNANSALDYDSSAIISGGIVVATGASGMAQNFSSSSTQGAILQTVSSQSANAKVSLTTADGQELATFTPSKGYNSILVSAPSLTVGGNYKLTYGSASTQITLTSLIYGAGGGIGGAGNPPRR